jgi:plasmid maintenance system antidote protein VapI
MSEIGKFVEERLFRLNKRPITAATAVGLERSYLRDLIVGKKQTIRADMIEKVAEAIGATPQDLIALQGSGDLPAAATQPAAIGQSQVHGKRILLIIGGGIAAYKCLDLIRRLRERGASVRPVMTRAATEFVTPLSVGALAADKVFTELFDREDEQDVGHIRLAREAT